MMKCKKLECGFLDFQYFLLSHLSHLLCEIANTIKSFPRWVALLCWLQSTLPVIHRDCGRKEKQSLTIKCGHPRKMRCRTASVVKKSPPVWMKWAFSFGKNHHGGRRTFRWRATQEQDHAWSVMKRSSERHLITIKTLQYAWWWWLLWAHTVQSRNL